MQNTVTPTTVVLLKMFIAVSTVYTGVKLHLTLTVYDIYMYMIHTLHTLLQKQ